jgi:hypothetical protein
MNFEHTLANVFMGLVAVMACVAQVALFSGVGAA